MLDRHKSVRDALNYVAANPESDKPLLEMEIWEIVARNLFTIALNPDTKIVGAAGRAVRAQKIILNRTTGTRRAGTAPAQPADQRIKFRDLTGKQLEK